MVQHDPPGSDQTGSYRQAAAVPPAMNWNAAGGRGLRTSLRSSKPAVARHAPSQTSQLQNTGSDEHRTNSATASKSELSSELAAVANDEIQDSSVMAGAASAKGSTAQGSYQASPGIATSEAALERLQSGNENSVSTSDQPRIVDMISGDSQEQAVHLSPQSVHLAASDSSNATPEQGIQALPSDISVTGAHLTSVTERPRDELHDMNGDAPERQNTDTSLSNGQLENATGSDMVVTANVSSVAVGEMSQSTAGSLANSTDELVPVENNETGTEDGEISDDNSIEAISFASHASDAKSEHQSSFVGRSFPDGIKHHDVAEIIEIESDDDAMVTNYANALQEVQTDGTSESRRQDEIIDLETAANHTKPDQLETILDSNEPQTLADLTAEQLEMQVRYFYITRDPATIPETDPVRCIICAGVGHLDLSCPAQTCSHCKTKGVHLSKDCPDIVRCGRCRGLHPTERCGFKLKPQNLVLTCDLCHERGHVEADCELVWRSSGALWKKPLPPLSIVRTCFNCGDSGHLGNDCRLRRPGKQMGSSMWSLQGLPDPLTPLPSADTYQPAPVAPTKNKQKLPNLKAKGVAAKLAKPAGSVQAPGLPFNTNSKQSGKPTIKNIKGRSAPTGIQIKGLASRASLDSPAYSPAPTAPRYPDRRDSQGSYHHNEYSTPTSSYPPYDQHRPDDAYDGYTRDRYVDQYRGPQSRPRSRSRSPRRWDSPPRHINYGSAPRDRWDRDDYNQSSHSGGSNRQPWQHNGR